MITPENYFERTLDCDGHKVSAAFCDDIAQTFADDCLWGHVSLPIAQKFEKDGITEYILADIKIEPDRSAREMSQTPAGEAIVLSRADILEGARRAIADGADIAPNLRKRIISALDDDDAGGLDVVEADAIFQFRVFGKIIFG